MIQMALNFEPDLELRDCCLDEHSDFGGDSWLEVNSSLTGNSQFTIWGTYWNGEGGRDILSIVLKPDQKVQLAIYLLTSLGKATIASR